MIEVADLALLGGHVALDFVNTIEDRGSPSPDDVLRVPVDLDRWAQRVGVGQNAASRTPVATGRDLAAAVQLREALHAVLRALDAGVRAPVPALLTVNRAIAEAHGARRLVPRGKTLEWEWLEPSAETIRLEVALAAEEILTDPLLRSRTRLCAAGGCGWFYLDHSKNHSRRWCSMRGCGTREKSRRRALKDRPDPA